MWETVISGNFHSRPSQGNWQRAIQVAFSSNTSLSADRGTYGVISPSINLWQDVPICAWGGMTTDSHEGWFARWKVRKSQIATALRQMEASSYSIQYHKKPQKISVHLSVYICMCSYLCQLPVTCIVKTQRILWNDSATSKMHCLSL